LDTTHTPDTTTRNTIMITQQAPHTHTRCLGAWDMCVLTDLAASGRLGTI
jgi:hypothetical protein